MTGSIAFLVVAYLALTILIYATQRKLQYFPQAEFTAAQSAGLAGFETVRLETADGEDIVTWYSPAPGAGPVIVYFHGNAGALVNRAERYQHFADEGFGVLAVSYRGYGGSSGSPSEAGLLADGRAALEFLEKQGVGRERLVLFGESLGTGVAVQLAADEATAPGALVLEAPFASAADVARQRYWFLPVKWLMKDQFRSIEFAPQVRVPVFIFHGSGDRVIPIAQGERLYGAFRGKKRFWRTENGGHIDPLTEEIWREITRFLAENGLRAPKRP